MVGPWSLRSHFGFCFSKNKFNLLTYLNRKFSPAASEGTTHNDDNATKLKHVETSQCFLVFSDLGQS